MAKPISAIVLAGGKGSRLGIDKARLTLRLDEGQAVGRTLLEGIVEKLLAISEEVIVVGHGEVLCGHLRARAVGDVYPGTGPLGGIYSGLQAATSHHALVVACDMPFLNLDLLRYMINQPRDYDVLIPKWRGRLEPLHAIYSKNCLTPIEELLKHDNLKILDFFDRVRVRYVLEEEINRYDSQHLSFFNINTSEQLRKAEAILRGLSHDRDRKPTLQIQGCS